MYNEEGYTTDVSYGYQQVDYFSGWWILLWVVVAIFAGALIWQIYKKIRGQIMRKVQLNLTRDWVMYRVLVPKEKHAEEDDQRKNFQELLAVIEPFYANINSVFSGNLFHKLVQKQQHISLEIIVKDGLVNFYVGCPRSIAEMVFRNLQAQYPSAEVTEDKDFSIFPKDKKLAIDITTVHQLKKYFFPIKTYKNLEEDPLNALTNSLSKLGEDELAGMQLLMRPTSGQWRISAERTAYKIQHGKSRLSYSNSPLVKTGETIFGFLNTAAAAMSPNKDGETSQFYDPKNPHKLTPMQEAQIKLLGEKAAKIGFECQLRIVGVAKDHTAAEKIVRNISSAYSQFSSPDSNSLIELEPKNKPGELANYIFRIYHSGKKMILNTEELATLYHLPNRFVDTPNIHWLLSKREAPPFNLPKEGTVVGNSVYRGQSIPVRIKESDRLRHVYMIGKTGVGKTVLFQNMIAQDIAEGKGVCYLDPNGDAAEWILKHIPKERADDVIYFNPADRDRPMGLNMLEWKTDEQRDFLVQEAIQIFQKLFDPQQTGIVGPQFEHWMRNAALTLMAHPDGGTIIDIPRLFTDPEFEKSRTKFVTDPVVKNFWEKQMAKTADFHKSEMLNYFTSKFGRFMTNDMMRNILGQTKSSFDFRDVMDNKKILICNLSKGLIGEINAFLLGMIIVSKIAMGAFSRQDQTEEERTPFYLYVDEFQNFITPVFAQILSESRKYKLGLSITNQYISQLDEQIRNAVIGNAGTIITFRVGAADAEFLMKEFDPLKLDDMTNIEKFNFYIKMLIDGTPTRPFNAASVYPADYEGNEKLSRSMKELSRLKFGKPREIVQEEILERSKVDMIDLPGLSSNQPTPMN
ncbi:MAG: type IV secretory system conjugative DNA transfer family protein [Candidatus Berkelbacteria bacterium]